MLHIIDFFDNASTVLLSSVKMLEQHATKRACIGFCVKSDALGMLSLFSMSGILTPLELT